MAGASRPRQDCRAATFAAPSHLSGDITLNCAMEEDQKITAPNVTINVTLWLGRLRARWRAQDRKSNAFFLLGAAQATRRPQPARAGLGRRLRHWCSCWRRLRRLLHPSAGSSFFQHHFFVLRPRHFRFSCYFFPSQSSSVVEQGTHKPLVGSSILPSGTMPPRSGGNSKFRNSKFQKNPKIPNDKIPKQTRKHSPQT